VTYSSAQVKGTVDVTVGFMADEAYDRHRVRGRNPQHHLHLGSSQCLFLPAGNRQHVTVDGATAVLENSTAQGRDQQLCISDSHGLRVLVWLVARENAPAPNPAGPHGVLAYARLLHLLGPDVAQWTANLLR
jgi:hypothetical protein